MSADPSLGETPEQTLLKLTVSATQCAITISSRNMTTRAPSTSPSTRLTRMSHASAGTRRSQRRLSANERHGSPDPPKVPSETLAPAPGHGPAPALGRRFAPVRAGSARRERRASRRRVLSSSGPPPSGRSQWRPRTGVPRHERDRQLAGLAADSLGDAGMAPIRGLGPCWTIGDCSRGAHGRRRLGGSRCPI